MVASVHIIRIHELIQDRGKILFWNHQWIDTVKQCQYYNSIKFRETKLRIKL